MACHKQVDTHWEIELGYLGVLGAMGTQVKPETGTFSSPKKR